MFAIVRDTPYDPKKLRERGEALAAFQAAHARQPGYAGTIVVDAGNGRWLTVNLWESEEQAATALPVMVPVVQRLLEPLMAGPSELIASGPVALTDLTRTSEYTGTDARSAAGGPAGAPS
jgi:hypothetical protein